MAEDAWDPSKPLPDEDDEKEAVIRANRQARIEYLTEQAKLKLQKTPPKKKGSVSW